MAIYKISPSAQNDLIDIYVRGFREWGESKADEYQFQLVAGFKVIAENPSLGYPVSIRPQLRRHALNPYIIFYRKFSYGVRISRILYKNRAMEKHL